MRKNTKKIVSATLGAAALLLVGGAIASANLYTANAETTEPEMKFAAYNLSLQDNIYIKFALSLDGVTKENVKVLVWEGTAPQDYTDGTQSSVLSSDETVTEGGVTYPVYKFTELSASEMTTEVYACAYAEVGGVKYYSEPVKYSILEYAYKKLGKVEEADKTTKENLPELLEAMLNYGAAAQKYTGANPERLANEEYFYVSVANATFEDGFNYGFFKAGEQVVVTPNDGYSLSAYASPAIFSENEKTGEIVLTVPATKFIDTDSFTDGTEILPAKPEGTEVTKSYVFANYPAGKQYAEGEVHELDDYITVTTTKAWFTSELRIYSNTTNNGNAVIGSANNYITKLAFNAGNNNDTLNVYGSEDGVTWTLIEGVEVTSAFNDGTTTVEVTQTLDNGDGTVTITGATYKYLKLDVAGSNQVQLKDMSLTLLSTEENPVIGDPTAGDKVAYEEENFTLETTEVMGGETLYLPTNGTTYTDVQISWAVADGETLATVENNNALKASNPEADTTLTVYATFTCDGESSAQVGFEITVKHVDETEAPTTETKTLSFDDTANRTVFNTSQQVWTQNGITVTNDKASSSTNVADYAKPARFYAKSSITVACTGMTKIVFTCSNASYATALKGSIGDSATASGSVVTVTLAEAVGSFTIDSLTAQVRINSIEVTAMVTAA